jgi:flagellar biosynthesis protein
VKRITKKTFALTYEGLSVPVLTAKGSDLLADEIIHLANKNNVPVISNTLLAEDLSEVDIGEEIPEIMYEAVAVVLSWAYWIKGRKP